MNGKHMTVPSRVNFVIPIVVVDVPFKCFRKFSGLYSGFMPLLIDSGRIHRITSSVLRFSLKVLISVRGKQNRLFKKSRCGHIGPFLRLCPGSQESIGAPAKVYGVMCYNARVAVL